MMEQQRLLADLLARLELPVPAAAQAELLWFLAELLRWNSKVNLTAITDPRDAVEKHLVDSLTVLPLLHGGERVLDVGSGGGFPGIPLKVVCPSLRLISVDAVGKKIAFQRHAARHLRLTDFTPLAARIEELPRQTQFRTGFDVVVSRAFASLADFARLAQPLLKSDGVLLAMKGAEGEGELATAAEELCRLGFDRNEVHHLLLPASGARRTLLCLRRAATPLV